MVFEYDCAEIIARQFPEFMISAEWEEHVLFWKNSENNPGLSRIFSVFSVFAENVHLTVSAKKSHADF